MAQLTAPDTIEVTSPAFVDGGHIHIDHAAKRVGGKDRSPALNWSSPPDGTTQLLLVVEDLDMPTGKPFTHALATIDPEQLDSAGGLAADDLSRHHPGRGVTMLRSSVGRGYHGPGPIKGHGEHRYLFELFALGAPLAYTSGRPRKVLERVNEPVLARGRLLGIYER